MQLAASAYNLPFDEAGRSYFFNCLSGALIRVPVGAESALAWLLEGVDRDEVPRGLEPLVGELERGGFLVDRGLDERAVLRARLREPVTEGTLGVTLVPTLACNLRCTYCFQDHTGGAMPRLVRDAVVSEIERRLATEPHERLDLDWFGGEPLLVTDVVLEVTDRAAAVAAAQGVTFEASMATNGTLLDGDTAARLRRSGFTELQITLDGPPDVHDARRVSADGGPTFGRVLAGIEAARSCGLAVSVRINVDRDTVTRATEVLSLLDERGLLAPEGGLRPYLAATVPLDVRCSHVAGSMMSADDYFRHVHEFREELHRRMPGADPEWLLDIPQPIERACGAASDRSLCVDPRGRVFKCGLEVHRPADAVGLLWADYRSQRAYRRWTELDAFARAECRECKSLPLCLGGCPRFEAGATVELRGESCAWFARHMVPMLRQYVRWKEVRDATRLVRRERSERGANG